MRIDLTWSQFKTQVDNKNLVTQYINKGSYYLIWAQDDLVLYVTSVTIETGNSDQDDFEENYKNENPNSLRSPDGKVLIRAESRPVDCTTCFVGIGDSENNIGDGKELTWDFSNSDDEVDMPSGSTKKRKRLEFSFLDAIWVKEGTIYYHNVPKGSYIDLYVVCPSGQYYLDNDGNPQLATEDTKICHYVSHHPMQGSVPMGDELNTECCSNEIPNNYKFWVEITVPDSDNTSNGVITLELYRTRTLVL